MLDGVCAWQAIPLFSESGFHLPRPREFSTSCQFALLFRTIDHRLTLFFDHALLTPHAGSLVVDFLSSRCKRSALPDNCGGEVGTLELLFATEVLASGAVF